MCSVRNVRRTRGARILATATAVAALAAVTGVPAYGAEAGQRVCVTGLEAGRPVALPDGFELRSPASVAVDHRGRLLVADTGNHRVLMIREDGSLAAEYGGFGWDDGQFDEPGDLSVYAGFFTYVLDRGNRRVQRFDVDGEYVDQVVRQGEAGSPVAIAVGRSGELLIVDEDSQSVLVRSQFDELLEPLGRFGTGEGGLVRPTAIDVGPRGEIAVADPGGEAVLVFDEFGTALYELTMPDTLFPSDVLFDRDGAVVVADPAHARIVAFPPGGGPATASLSLDGTLVPDSVALYDPRTLVALDSDAGGLLLIRMTHAECGARR